MRTSPENAIDTVLTGGTVVDVEVDDVEDVEVEAGAVDGGTSVPPAESGTVGAPASSCEQDAITTSANAATERRAGRVRIGRAMVPSGCVIPEDYALHQCLFAPCLADALRSE